MMNKNEQKEFLEKLALMRNVQVNTKYLVKAFEMLFALQADVQKIKDHLKIRQ